MSLFFYDLQKAAAVQKWCYTLNNPTSEPLVDEDLVEYHVYGEEVGESGTPHYQGFIIFKTRVSLNTLQHLIPRAHYEIAKGKNSQAANYCKKDGNFKEVGTLPPDPGVKGGEAIKERYEAAFKLAKCGDLDTIDCDLLIKHYRTLKQIRIDYVTELPPLDQTAGIWIYGDSGVGKSSYARKTYPGAYVKNCNKWWDGYQEEENVIIDDLDDSHHILGHYLKRWADHYAFTAETKGGSVYIRPKKIIVTSQFRIEDIFKDGPTATALLRRFEFINFNKHPDRVVQKV